MRTNQIGPKPSRRPRSRQMLSPPDSASASVPDTLVALHVNSERRCFWTTMPSKTFAATVTADGHRYIQRAGIRGAFLILIDRADRAVPVEDDLTQSFTRPNQRSEVRLRLIDQGLTHGVGSLKGHRV